MKLPILKPILILINSIIIGLTMALLISPILSCLFQVNYHIEDFAIVIFFILTMGILYKFSINQKIVITINTLSLFLTFLTIKISTTNTLEQFTKFAWKFCHNLYPTGENPTLGFFVISLLFIIWFFVGCAILFSYKKIKKT